MRTMWVGEHYGRSGPKCPIDRPLNDMVPACARYYLADKSIPDTHRHPFVTKRCTGETLQFMLVSSNSVDLCSFFVEVGNAHKRYLRYSDQIAISLIATSRTAFNQRLALVCSVEYAAVSTTFAQLHLYYESTGGNAGLHTVSRILPDSYRVRCVGTVRSGCAERVRRGECPAM